MAKTKAPVLTVGMATYDDFDGVVFTLQSIRMTHRDALPYIDFIVVDNNARSADGQVTKSFCESIGVRYIDMPEPKGTSQPRNRVFEESHGLATMCIDPHILINPGALKRLVDYYLANPETPDLIQGPLWYDDLVNISTHFNDIWRSEMHGTWDTDPAVYDPADPKQRITERQWRWSEEHGKPIATQAPYADLNLNHAPLEIPSQGLGLFSCITKNWLGFHKSFRGFGAEEGYIHEKYRQAGAQCLSMPWLLWWHRFARPAGVPYPLTAWNKARNYVLGRIENGQDLAPVYRHFVEGMNSDNTPLRQNADGRPVGSLPQHEWESLIEDPERPLPKGAESCGTCGQDAVPTGPVPIEALFARAKTNPSDMHEHAEKLRELARQSEHVVDFSMRHEVSTVALAAGLPQRLTTIALREPTIFRTLKQSVGDKVKLSYGKGDSRGIEIPECDLLFIDTVHTGEAFRQELDRHAPKVRRWIVRHDTQIYGEHGEGGGPGLMVGLRAFLKENPEWSVVYHTNTNYGLTVISRDERDKPKLPSKIKMAANFAKAVTRHVATGARDASPDEFEKRLAICSICPHRNNANCSICGCVLADKAKWQDQQCPIGKWDSDLDAVIEEG